MCLPPKHLVSLYNHCCKYQLSTTDVGIVSSLCYLDCQRWKKGSAAVCSEQPLLWTDTCTLKYVVYPTTCPLKLSKLILNLVLMLLLKWNWSSFTVVLCPWLNCCGTLLCSLNLFKICPPSQIHLPSVWTRVCVWFFSSSCFEHCFFFSS